MIAEENEPAPDGDAPTALPPTLGPPAHPASSGRLSADYRLPEKGKGARWKARWQGEASPLRAELRLYRNRALGGTRTPNLFIRRGTRALSLVSPDLSCAAGASFQHVGAGPELSYDFDFGADINAKLAAFREARRAASEASREYIAAGREVSTLLAWRGLTVSEIAAQLREQYLNAAWLQVVQPAPSEIIHIGGVGHHLRRHLLPCLARTAATSARAARVIAADALRHARHQQA